jgi:TP901 family phage tail tape measure protein
LQGVNVNIQVQGSPQAQKQLQQVTQQANQATTAAERMGKAFALSIRRFAAFSIATRAVGLFTSSLGNAVESAIDFERQLIKVAQVTGKSIGQLRGLTREITSLSTGFGVASSDLLEVSTVLAQAGLSAEDTSVALRTLAKAALAPNFDSITETAEGAIAILAQFGQGVGALEKQLGSINAVAGAFAVEASDLIDVIRRTGGVFKASGGDLNELLALFTSVRATTRESAESIGTGLRTIFTRIQRPKTIEFLKQFGVELVDLNGKFVGPFEAIKKLSEALAGLGEGDLTFISIAEELGGFRQIGKVLPLLQQFTTAQQALNVATKAGDSLTNDAASAQAALAIRIMKVKEEFLALIRSITETSTFQIMANTALSLASALIKIGDSIKPLLPMLAALAAFKIAKGLGSFFGGMMSGATSGRAYNKGGKVLGFARGGLVPGSGNRDTVPAMLAPGEFVIRKTSVNKMGAGTLAAMNENRFQEGGPMTTAQKIAAARNQTNLSLSSSPRQAKDISTISTRQPPFASKQSIGIATASYLPSPVFGSIAFDRDQMLNQSIGTRGQSLTGIFGDKAVSYFNKIFPSGKGKGFSYPTTVEGIGKEEEGQFKSILDRNVGLSITNAASDFAKNILKTTLDTPIQILPNFYESIDKGFRGNFFENVISALNGKPLRGADTQRPFDFTKGIGKFKNIYRNLPMNYVDARVSALSAGVAAGSETQNSREIFTRKAQAQLADELYPQMLLLQKQNETLKKQSSANQLVSTKTPKSPRKISSIDESKLTNFVSGQIYNDTDIGQAGVQPSQYKQGFDKIAPGKWRRKYFGGLIQKFAVGGEAQAIADKLGKGKSRTWWSGQAYGKQLLTDTSLAGVWDAVTGQLVKLDPMQGKMLREMAMREQANVVSKPVPAKKPESEADLKARLEQERKATGDAAIARAKSMSADSDKSMIEIEQKNKTKKINESIRAQAKEVREATRDYRYRQRMKKFAAGGGVGTDTVPALLTPGEFVVNRSSAQRIGYGNLNRMNKVGKYAKGGIVQRFAKGGAASGGTGDMFGGFGGQVTLISATLQSLLPPLEDTSSGFTKVAHQLMTLVTTIGGVIFSLGAFGISLNAKNIMNLFGKGPASIGGILQTGMKGLFGDKSFSTMKGALKNGPLTTAAYRGGAMLNSVGSRASGAFSGLRDVVNTKGSSLNKGFSAGFSGKNVIGSGSKSLLGTVGGFIGQGARTVSNLGKSAYEASNLDVLPTAFKLGKQGKTLTSFGGGRLPMMSLPANVARLGNTAGRFTNSQFAKGLGAGFTEKNLSFGKILGSGRGVLAKTGGVIGKSAGMVSRGASAVGSKIAGIGLGPAAGALGILQVVNSMVGSFRNLDGQLKKSIESGNELEAMSLAAKNAAASFPLIGNLIGGWNDGLDSILIGLQTTFGGSTLDSIKSLASAQAGAVKTQKQLEQAQKIATTAMEDFKNGSISASEALAKIRAASTEVQKQEKRAGDFAVNNLENRASGGFTGRNVASFLTLGLVESSTTRNERLGKQSAEQINQASKFQAEAFNMESPARQAAIRSGIVRGKNINEVRAEATSDLQSRISQQRLLGNQLQSSGDTEGSKAAFAAAEQMELQLKQVNKEIENIEKEVKRQKDLYDAMNLGLRAATATSSALSATMSRFSSGLEVGGSTLVNDVEFLQQSMSSAAQAMNPDEIKDAVSNVSSNLREFGVGDEYIKKFEGNVAAFTSAQQNYNKAFDNIKNSMAEADFKGLSADDLKKKFADELTKGMDDQGAKSLRAAIEGMDLNDDEVSKIIAGDLSVFGDKLSDVQKKMFEDLQKIAQERAKAEQVLIDFTKKRIEAERNLVAAQQEALDLTLEGREVQAKYGGRAVSSQERRVNILGKSNVEGNRLGLTAMRTGSIEELRARNAEIRGGFANIEARRTQRGGMAGKAGEEADAKQKDLEKAYKTQIDTIRNLIKLEEEQLKITQEKNKLEKESMESLIKGDVEEFFKKQSAVGATAAIASGDTRLQNYYGAEALGMAYQDIQRQQEAGVQELYGQQLAGAGGLTERAAGSALSARGITDTRAAQVMAGTTAEEEASKSRLRELGGMLGETGQLGADMAEMQVTTATMNVTAAQVKFDETMARGREKAEEGLAAEDKAAAEFKSRGGMIYASRGIFVPRGTDTVPAMLTPGEFVVNRAAVQRDNNLQILQAMNNNSSAPSMAGEAAAMSRGGMVQYLAEGGRAKRGGFFSGMLSGVTDGLSQLASNFGSQISAAVDKLKGISIKLDSNSNVNVNINDSSGILKMLKEDTRKEILSAIEREFKDSQGGSLKRNSSVLGS